MATDNVNQSGASAVADSAKEETASLDQATGPDNAAEETRAATDADIPAQNSETQTSDDTTAEQANDAESAAATSAPCLIPTRKRLLLPNRKARSFGAQSLASRISTYS